MNPNHAQAARMAQQAHQRAQQQHQQIAAQQRQIMQQQAARDMAARQQAAQRARVAQQQQIIAQHQRTARAQRSEGARAQERHYVTPSEQAITTEVPVVGVTPTNGRAAGSGWASPEATSSHTAVATLPPGLQRRWKRSRLGQARAMRDGQNGGRKLPTTFFRLEAFDPHRGRLAGTPVRLRGPSSTGFAAEGDWVEIRSFNWRGVRRPLRAFNHSTGALYLFPLRYIAGAVALLGLLVAGILLARSDLFKDGNPAEGVGGLIDTETMVMLPNVVGANEADAIRTLESAGVRGAAVMQTSDLPAGQVIEQRPAAGAELEKGRTVELIVSSGPTTTIPPATHVPPPTVAPPPTIIQTPPSQPSNLVSVPPLIGMPFDSAADTLDTRRIAFDVIEEPSITVELGHVIRTDPAAGTQVKVGDSITVFLSSGPAQVDVPDVLDLPLRQAEKVMEESGLKSQPTLVDCGPGRWDRVDWTDPEPGTKMVVGSTITLGVCRRG